MKRFALTLAIASLVTFFPVSAALAGEANFEIAAGAYVSGTTGFVGEEGILGLRGGYRFTERWGLQGSLSRVDLFDAVSPFVDVDGDATFFDVSGMFFITPRRRAELFVYGGVGYARFDVDVAPIRLDLPHVGRIRLPGFGFTVEDDFTGHLGLGVNIRLSEKMYLRPDIKVRWLGSLESGTADAEPSLGLGWRF